MSTTTKMSTTTLTLSFDKSKLKAFIHKLCEIVDREYNSTDHPLPWKALWMTWKNKGLKVFGI